MARDNDSIGSTYDWEPQIGTTIPISQLIQTGITQNTPQLYRETRGMSLEQFLMSRYSPWKLQADGTLRYTGITQNPTWIDQGGAGDGGIPHALKKMAPLAGMALGVGGLVNGLAGAAGAAGAGGVESFLPNSFDMMPSALGDAAGMGVYDVVPASASFGSDNFATDFDFGELPEGWEETMGESDWSGIPDVGDEMLSSANGEFPPVAAMSGQGAGSSWWTQIGNMMGIPPGVQNAIGGLLGGSSGQQNNLLNGLLEYLNSNKNRDFLQDQMNQIQERADPFASQRGYYQNLLRSSYEDPNFMKNNPQFSGITKMATDEAQRAAAARGYNNSSNVLHSVAENVQNKNLNFLLPWQGQVAQNAGAGISPAAGASLQAQGVQNIVNANNQRSGALGNMVSQLPNLIGQLGNSLG